MFHKQPSEKAPGKKKPNILLRLLASLLTLVLILGAVALVVYRDELNLDSLRRWFTYRDLERGDSGQAQSFSHDGSLSDHFAILGSDLLLASPTGYRLYSGSGVKYVDTLASMSAPVASSAGDYGLVYDAGGKTLALFYDKAQVFDLTLEGERSILSARVNPSGFLAVTAQATGYKGSVTVYDASHNAALSLNLSSSFLMDAVITADNKSLAAITIGQVDGAFESRLNFYSLDYLRTKPADPVPDASCSLGNNLALDFREHNGTFWVLCENDLSAVSSSGAPLGRYDYSGRFLKEFSLTGDGFAVTLLGKYRAGTLSDLTVVDPTGAATATLSMNEQVLSLSAAGRYIAVLTADRLDIYTSDLTLYNTLDGIQGARKVLMRADGTAMLIANDTARLYIPG